MKRDNKKEVMNALIMVFQFGINMIVPIFLCTLAGVWIGKKTGADWVTVPLFFLGAFAGANNIYRMVQKFLKPEDRKSTRLNSSHWNKSRMPSSA